MDEKEVWEAAIEWMNRTNGYAAGFHYKDASEKEFVEDMITHEWCESMRYLFDVAVGEHTLNQNDPPDFHVEIDGERIGVEIVLLVSEKHLRLACQGKTTFIQWTKEDFANKIKEVIKQKCEKYTKRAILKTIDVLLMMCIEPLVSSEQARDWLRSFDCPRCDKFHSVCMLFDYEPGRATHSWPLIWLYGERWRRSVR